MRREGVVHGLPAVILLDTHVWVWWVQNDPRMGVCTEILDAAPPTEVALDSVRNKFTLRSEVSGPPAGLINVGGYRFAWRELQDLLAELGEGGSLAALPDPVAGHRLAGVAADRERVRSALLARGVNPLVVAAFRDRR